MNASNLEDAAAAVAAPDPDRLARWLVSPAVVREDGAVMSWAGPRGDGYPYPEVAGLWLAAACGAELLRAPEALVDRVASRLVADVSADGGVGRNGRTYLFDTAVAANGLGWYARSRSGRYAETVAGLLRQVASWTKRRLAVIPEPDGDPAHWSNRFGTHQLKTVVCLFNHRDLVGDADAREGVEALLASLVPALRREGPTVAPGETLGYSHGAAYAVEGTTFAARVAGLAPEALVRDGTSLLASLQRPDGSLLAWFDRDRRFGPARNDATAQAIRLWVADDACAWAGEIERALAWLGDAQAPSGALRYGADSDDENTWVSLFALQALRWLERGADLATVL